MIDLHNHLLFGVDDGANDIDESLALARQAVSEGVSQIAATPHLDPERNNGIGREDVIPRVLELRTRLDSEGIELNIVPGNELYLTTDAPALITAGVVATLGQGRAVLVETSTRLETPPSFLYGVLIEIRQSDYVPVLAHPERYLFVQHRIDVLEPLLEVGVVMQLTAPSLLGEYGPVVQRTCKDMLRRGMYGLAASDRHHPQQRRSLASLHADLSKLADTTCADLLLRSNAERLLADQPLLPVPSVL